MGKRRKRTQPSTPPKPAPPRRWRIRLPYRPRFIAAHWLIVAAIAVPALSGLLPLTYDEAWNYLNLSTHGVRTVLGSYPFPNNHVLFTAAQALLLDGLPDWWPPLLRLPNLVYAAALLGVVTALLERSGYSGSHAVWGAAAVVFAAPIPALYTLVARGYLLGLLLVASAFLAAVDRRHFLAALLMALATWCVPTFVYWWPPFLLLPLAEEGLRKWRAWKTALLSGMLFGALVAAAYSPLWSQVKRFAFPAGWDLPETPWRLLQGVAQHALFLNALLPQGAATAVFLLAVALLAAGWHASTIRNARGRILLLVLAGIVSGFAVPAAAWAAQTSRLPFVRNLIVVPFLIALGLAVLPTGVPRLPRIRKIEAASLFLAANAILGAGWLVQSCVTGDLDAFPGYASLRGTPIERAILRGVPLEGTQLRTTTFFEPVVQAYQRRYRYSVELLPRPPAGPCLTGSRPPREDMILVARSGQWLELCY